MEKSNYLTENLLNKFLIDRFDGEIIIRNKKVSESNVRLRPDFQLPRLKLIIEFNGYQHYTLSKTIINDDIKTKCYTRLGYTIINIPYFVQLDNRIVKFLFDSYNTKTNEFNKYPHGFIDKKAALPSDFCELGQKRFLHDLNNFSIIRKEIVNSLKDKISETGNWRSVCFKKLYSMI